MNQKGNNTGCDPSGFLLVTQTGSCARVVSAGCGKEIITEGCLSVQSRDSVSLSTGSSRASNIPASEIFKILPALLASWVETQGNEEVNGHQVNNQGRKEEKLHAGNRLALL